MAKSFSTKKYFSKIHNPELLADFYEKHSIVAILGITEKTPRKTATDIMMDFYKSIEPSKRIDIEKELTLINILSTKYSVPLFKSILKQKKLPHEETTIECKTDQDKVLYYYLYNKDIFDEVLFFHDFYVSRGYMLYEAKEVEMNTAEFAITELTKEFKRIANKEERATECEVTANKLDDLLYIHVIFEGGSHISPSRNKITGELDRTRTIKKQEEVKIVYFPLDKEVLISYTGSKHEKIIFLDTFLRIVCNSGFDDKVESFNLNVFKKQDFDFTKTNKGTPLLNWKLKNITLTLGGGDNNKRKMKLSLPSSVQENGLNPLFTTLDELGLTKLLQSCVIENVALSFSFLDKHKADKSVNVSCSLSTKKSSLCPLFPYDRHTRTLLKQSGIDGGFIEQVKNDSDKVIKKWEE
ncbi:hypothetical protein K9M47_01680 [Candidatus Gracilibacteria bacterium]|nr:hypothetical protein [Candidatus Gracilibacteria bacterium]